MFQDQDKSYSPRRPNPPNPDTHARNLQHTIKSLQDEIQLTIYNYENILQTQKKNSAQRSEFLLYLIQSLRTRHLQQLESLNTQIQAAEGERESVQAMQKQMENIGDGLDQITEENQKLKTENQSLNREIDELDGKDKELDEEIEGIQRELEECKLRIDDWERVKIKWNRHKKELLQMIEDAEKEANAMYRSESDEDQKQQNSICNQTGLNIKLCQHCQKLKIQQLKIKYNNHLNSSNNHSPTNNSTNNITHNNNHLNGYTINLNPHNELRKST